MYAFGGNNEDKFEDPSQPNQHNDEEAKIQNLAKRIQEYTQQFAQVEQEKLELDATVAELKQAVLLRIEMDKCASKRTRNTMLQDVKATYIFPSSLIISILLSNNSRFCLDNWDLMVTLSSLNRTSMLEDSFNDLPKQPSNKPCICSSKAVKLPLLAGGHQFETVLTFDSAFQDLNVLLNITLLKTFFVDKQPRIIRIEMESKILSSWDLIDTSRLIFGATPIFPTHERQKRPPKAISRKHSKNCFLPRKMLFLLIGNNAEPVDLFKFLLPKALYTDCQSNFSGYVPCRDKAVEVNVTVEKQDTGLTVAIVGNSSIVTNDLVESLKAKILIAFSRIWCEPLILNDKDREYFTDYSTMESAWTSLLEKFM